MKEFTWVVSQIGRLDSTVKKHLPQYDKRAIASAIQHHRCRVNGIIERFESYKVKPQDHISIVFLSTPSSTQEHPCLWQHEQYSVYDKNPHVSTEQLIKQTSRLVIHRLDRDTSGCLLVAHTEQAQTEFLELFKTRQVHKQYLALVFGKPQKQEGELVTYTTPKHKRCGAVLFANTEKQKGKVTITRWQILKTFERYSLLLCSPITGRTHQIRLHMKTLGHPIVGDVDYGDKIQPRHTFRPLLHAYSLKFPCPFSKEQRVITSTNYRELSSYVSQVPDFPAPHS